MQTLALVAPLPVPRSAEPDQYDLTGPGDTDRWPRPEAHISATAGPVPPQVPRKPLDPRDVAVKALAQVLRTHRLVEDPGSVAAAAVDFALATASDSAEELRGRLGSVYDVMDLRRWLSAPGADPLTVDDVLALARARSLVVFTTDDDQSAFPHWQFDSVAGQLVVDPRIRDLWRALPHDGWLPDADLVLWMRTRFHDLDRRTPIDWLRDHDLDDPRLQHALQRLRRRAD